MIDLYDYYSIYSNKNFEFYINSNEFEAYFKGRPKFIQKSKFRYDYPIENYYIGIQGINCDKEGNYAFNSDEEFSKVNLIEVNIPQGAERHHLELIELGTDISKHFGWIVNWEG